MLEKEKLKKETLTMENAQRVRHIPIFVEGRDEPVINKGHDNEGAAAPQHVNEPPPHSSNNTSAFASAESSSVPHHQTHHNFGRPPMGFEGDMGFGRDNLGFGQDIPLPSGSIFDRAKDFPVRDFFNMRSASPRRSESPSNVYHQQYHPSQHQSRNSPSPAAPQQRQAPPQSYNQDRQVPVHHDTKRSSTPQRQQEPPQAAQPQQQAPMPEQGIPAKQKAVEDSITKIQNIQASVLDLMSRVEQFDGTNKREYNFLDEMLTQDLLKLDNIDAEGKENIKSARREAIKCINSLISLLEAKKDQFEKEQGEQPVVEEKSEAPSSTVELETPTQAVNGVNGASRNSSYDNVNNVKQTSSNNSVNMPETNKNKEVSAEVSLEAKVQEAVQKQDEQQK